MQLIAKNNSSHDQYLKTDYLSRRKKPNQEKNTVRPFNLNEIELIQVSCRVNKKIY